MHENVIDISTHRNYYVCKQLVNESADSSSYAPLLLNVNPQDFSIGLADEINEWSDKGTNPLLPPMESYVARIDQNQDETIRNMVALVQVVPGTANQF